MQGANLLAVLYAALPDEPVPEGEEELPDLDFGCDNLVLEIRRGKRHIYIGLTSLTEEELLMFREIINEGVEAALPVVRHIDREATAANESGTMFVPRTFRVRPVIHRRGGPIKLNIPTTEQGEPDGHTGEGGA